MGGCKGLGVLREPVNIAQVKDYIMSIQNKHYANGVLVSGCYSHHCIFTTNLVPKVVLELLLSHHAV